MGHLSMQIPFRFRSVDENDEKFFKISVRVEAYNEIYLSRFFKEYYWLCPIWKNTISSIIRIYVL